MNNENIRGQSFQHSQGEFPGNQNFHPEGSHISYDAWSYREHLTLKLQQNGFSVSDSIPEGIIRSVAEAYSSQKQTLIEIASVRLAALTYNIPFEDPDTTAKKIQGILHDRKRQTVAERLGIDAEKLVTMTDAQLIAVQQEREIENLARRAQAAGIQIPEGTTTKMLRESQWNIIYAHEDLVERAVEAESMGISFPPGRPPTRETLNQIRDVRTAGELGIIVDPAHPLTTLDVLNLRILKQRMERAKKLGMVFPLDTIPSWEDIIKEEKRQQTPDERRFEEQEKNNEELIRKAIGFGLVVDGRAPFYVTLEPKTLSTQQKMIIEEIDQEMSVLATYIQGLLDTT